MRRIDISRPPHVDNLDVAGALGDLNLVRFAQKTAASWPEFWTYRGLTRRIQLTPWRES
jgi:hypothetical protein